jgi:SAM-dependent methyltransferase
VEYEEIDIAVIQALCKGHPRDRGFGARLVSNPKALFLSHWVNHFEWQFAAQCFPVGSLILDWGCGTGHADIFLARQGYQVVGTDISRLGIQIASYVRSLQTPELINRVSFHLEAPQLPYDFAWTSHVLEHVPKDEWQEFFRLITNAGASQVLVSVPRDRAYFDPDHKNFWQNPAELEADLVSFGKVVPLWASEDPVNEVLRAMVRI